MKRFAIQYASGLFSDRNWKQAWSRLKPGAADTLALLGNCGSVANSAAKEQTYKFMRKATAHWDHILWVMGPHEFTSDTRHKTPFYEQRDALKEIAKGVGGGGNILILDQTELVVPGAGAVILGVSGWGRLATSEERIPAPEGQSIWFADEVGRRPLTAAVLEDWAAGDMEWLTERVEWWSRHRPLTKIVILSHGLCSPELVGAAPPVVGRLHLDVLHPADTLPLLLRPNVKGWLCGAAGSCVSGVVGRYRCFVGANSLFSAAGPVGTGSPAFLADRLFEVGGTKKA
jgi:hypothetical protein